MTVLMPRLDREQSQALIEVADKLSITEIADRMPERGVTTTSSELGGLEIAEQQLNRVRVEVLALARSQGYPDALNSIADFEASCAELLHAELAISPHEASSEGVWSYLTICWLLDVAVWRWSGTSGERRRFHGDVNRNTFRRLWWRVEIFGPDLDLAQLSQDDFLQIMERPTITSNRRFVRILAAQFLARIEREAGYERATLMREACKHIIRITPVVDFFALSDRDLDSWVEAILDAAATATAIGTPATRDSGGFIVHSDSVEQVTELASADVAAAGVGSGDELPPDVAELARVAIGLAQRAGTVTNASLRGVVPIDATTARQLLQGLVDRGELSRRGKARGTFYVIAEPSPVDASATQSETSQGPSPSDHPRTSPEADRNGLKGADVHTDPATTVTDRLGAAARNSDSGSEHPIISSARPAREALRRLLRRS
jgi:hypothetical protein